MKSSYKPTYISTPSQDEINIMRNRFTKLLRSCIKESYVNDFTNVFLNLYVEKKTSGQFKVTRECDSIFQLLNIINQVDNCIACFPSDLRQLFHNFVLKRVRATSYINLNVQEYLKAERRSFPSQCQEELRNALTTYGFLAKPVPVTYASILNNPTLNP